MTDGIATDITALILAGGRAERMGGRDKGLLECGGRPLVERVVTRIAPGVHTVLISANRNLGSYRRLGYPVHEDRMAGYQGPLAGIASGLAACATTWLWALPCDAPGVDTGLLTRLISACTTADSKAAVPVQEGRMQATFVLLHRDVAASLQDYLARGGRAAHEWLKEIAAVTVDCEDQPAWFRNINTPQDLATCASGPGSAGPSPTTR